MTAAKKPKHTPGPWRVDEYGMIRDEAGDWIVARPDDGGHLDGIRLISEEEEEANGRLISAAPDLLAALKDLARCCSRADWTMGHGVGIKQRTLDAIAKAEG